MAGLPPNIYEQQVRNRRLTVLILVAFALFIGILGLGFDTFLLEQELFPYPTLTALAVGVFFAGRGFLHGDTTVLHASGAQPVSPDDPKFRQLRNVVEEMSIASGLPAPALYVIHDPDPNAFATGRDPSTASIAVTEGLVERLTRDELQAVVAHEMSHVRNYDIRLMTVVAALVGAVLLLTEIGLRTGRVSMGRSSGRKRGGGGMFALLYLIVLILAPLVARLLAMAVSRNREYLADASAAELTRNPAALASALQKIADAVEPTRSIKKGTAHLCIADPTAQEVNEEEGWWADLFATHPPIRKRIMLLRSMAYIHA
jgi:heat shock protein HtpX